jgi:hypothetical protein
MFVYHNAPIGLKTFSIGRYDLLTSNNLLYRDAIVHENLTISPIGAFDVRMS